MLNQLFDDSMTHKKRRIILTTCPS